MKMTWDEFAALPVLGSFNSDEIENGKSYRVRNAGYRAFIAIDVEIDVEVEQQLAGLDRTCRRFNDYARKTK